MKRLGIALACAAIMAMPIAAQVKKVDAKSDKPIYVVGVSGMT